jgi:hypothetical protein
MRDRLRCLFGGHDFPDWPAWQHAGRSAYYRQRFCRRCQRKQEQNDG